MRRLDRRAVVPCRRGLSSHRTSLLVWIFLMGVLAICLAPRPATADEMSILLEILVEKGILTQEEAAAVREETIRRREAEKRQAETAARETARKTAEQTAQEAAEPAAREAARETAQATAQEAVAAVAEKVEKGVTAFWKDGFWVQSADGNFRFRPTGRLQFDFNAFDAAHPADVPDSSFFFRRARLGVEGYLYKYWKFSLDGDFGTGNEFTMQDAYIEAQYWDQLHLAFGQVKVAFSREQMRSSKYLDTIERSIITNTVAPNFDVGVFATGELFEGYVDYGLSVFNGERRAEFNGDENYEVSGRLNFKPFHDRKGSLFEKFELGANVSFEDDEGGSDVRLRPYGRARNRPADIGRDRSLVGDKVLSGVDALWMYGPVSLQAEYLEIDHDNAGRAPADIVAGVRSESEADGFRLTGTWLLTGEEKTQRRIKPHQNFNPFRGDYGVGAWELVAQYENAEFDSVNPAADNRVDALTLGLNWWLNPFLRWSFNWVHEDFDEVPPGFRHDDADVYLSRLGIEW